MRTAPSGAFSLLCKMDIYDWLSLHFVFNWINNINQTRWWAMLSMKQSTWRYWYWKCTESIVNLNTFTLLNFLTCIASYECVHVHLLHECVCAVCCTLGGTLQHRQMRLQRVSHAETNTQKDLFEWILNETPAKPVGSKALQRKLVSCVNHGGRGFKADLCTLTRCFSESAELDIVHSATHGGVQRELRGPKMWEVGGVGTFMWSSMRSEGQRQEVGLWDLPWSPSQCPRFVMWRACASFISSLSHVSIIAMHCMALLKEIEREDNIDCCKTSFRTMAVVAHPPYSGYLVRLIAHPMWLWFILDSSLPYVP